MFNPSFDAYVHFSINYLPSNFDLFLRSNFLKKINFTHIPWFTITYRLSASLSMRTENDHSPVIFLEIYECVYFYAEGDALKNVIN